MNLHIVVCAGIVPDPLQTLEPVTGPNGPGLKNEMLLPAVQQAHFMKLRISLQRILAVRSGLSRLRPKPSSSR